MHFKSITLRNFLSFGPDAEEIPLGKLNVLVGINGSGKSNLLEAFKLIQTLPHGIGASIRKGGGVESWIWKYAHNAPTSNLEVIVERGSARTDLRYAFSFAGVNNRFEITDELIENAKLKDGQTAPHFYYKFENGSPLLNAKTGEGFKIRTLRREDIDPDKSILEQRKDRDSYPEITRLGEFFADGIRVYRDWGFGSNSPARDSQPSDLKRNWLETDCSNLFLVLSDAKLNIPFRNAIREALRSFNPDFVDYQIETHPRSLNLFLEETEGALIPAVRLSDGTLRFLSLLAILLHPTPPAVVCIDEPELGMHPDSIPLIADLLKSASERSQLIVTTHSDLLIDALSDQPRSVFVCERDSDGTHIRPLDAEEVAPWLEEYRLGQYWLRGGIGGVR